MEEERRLQTDEDLGKKRQGWGVKGRWLMGESFVREHKWCKRLRKQQLDILKVWWEEPWEQQIAYKLYWWLCSLQTKHWKYFFLFSCLTVLARSSLEYIRCVDVHGEIKPGELLMQIYRTNNWINFKCHGKEPEVLLMTGKETGWVGDFDFFEEGSCSTKQQLLTHKPEFLF